MDAIVLCGGKGTRLATVVNEVPKPLAPVGGRPFLDYLLSYLDQSGIVARVILATGHMAAKVEAHYGHRFCNLPIVYSPEEMPLGTGGAVVKAMRRFHVQAPFLILNGDSFVDADLAALSRLLNDSHAGMAMTLYQVDDAARFGTVAWDGIRVTSFIEKTGRGEPGLINAGIYAATPEAFGTWIQSEGFVSLEQTVLPELVGLGSVTAIQSGGRFIDIGLPETYASAAAFFSIGR